MKKKKSGRRICEIKIMDAFVLVCTNKSKKKQILLLNLKPVTVHRQEFSELKIPYDTILVADFADLECEVSAKSRYWSYMCEQ